jgi:hypothetical protein
MSCSTNATRSAGVSESSTTSSASPTESASSASFSGPNPSLRLTIGSGTRATVTSPRGSSRRALRERSMSRHTRARTNVAVVTFAFMAALFGTAVTCGTWALWALFAWDERFAPYLLVDSALYLVGTILLTIVYHTCRETMYRRTWSRAEPTPSATGPDVSRAGPRGTTFGSRRPSLHRPRSPSRSASRGSRRNWRRVIPCEA